MPIKASAYKALRQSRKLTERNKNRKRIVRELIKKSLTAVQQAETDAVKQAQLACTAIDKAVQKGTLHANTGARKKSRLMKKVNSFLKAKA
ncbi:MAG: 30S ribosomal protein S20 [Patescibacteria group bacterium]|jgi:small subunit ribosomal protein S20